MSQFFNISGESTQELIAVGNNTDVSKISLTNIEGTNKCTIDLYIEKKFKGKFYLLKGVELPIGATLIHDNIKFSNSAGEFGLYVKLTKSASETPAVDIIIN